MKITPLPRCIVTVTALATLVALGLAPLSPVLGQTSNTTAPDGTVTPTSQSLPTEVVNNDSAIDPFSYATIAAIIVASLSFLVSCCYVYAIFQDHKHRLRPILSWSSFEGGYKIKVQEFIGGGCNLTVQITNVGQTAAVDIEAEKGIIVEEHGTTSHIPIQNLDLLGALHPSASTTITMMLSYDEYQKLSDDTLVKFTIDLKYKTVNNKKFSYKIVGTYSQTTRDLYGPASETLSL